MALPEVVSREEWLAARRELLKREKEFTREKDRLNAARRMLPMVRVEAEYWFAGPEGRVSLADLFGGQEQLIVRHIMFAPEADAPCPMCSASMDEFGSAVAPHLRERRTAFVAVSRAPYPKLAAWRARRGWGIGWYSSFGSRFNYDFHVSLDESVAPVEYNYRGRVELQATGMSWATACPMELSGYSCFLRTGDGLFHTYSTYARGVEAMELGYALLDLTALGRQEPWEEPKGRTRGTDP